MKRLIALLLALLTAVMPLLLCGCAVISSGSDYCLRFLKLIEQGNYEQAYDMLDESLKKADDPEVTVIPDPTPTPDPNATATPAATDTPNPDATDTPAPTDTPDPDATVDPNATPNPEGTPNPEETPDAADTPDPSATPTAAPMASSVIT